MLYMKVLSYLILIIEIKLVYLNNNRTIKFHNYHELVLPLCQLQPTVRLPVPTLSQ